METHFRSIKNISLIDNINPDTLIKAGIKIFKTNNAQLIDICIE